MLDQLDINGQWGWQSQLTTTLLHWSDDVCQFGNLCHTTRLAHPAKYICIFIMLVEHGLCEFSKYCRFSTQEKISGPFYISQTARDLEKKVSS